MATATKTDTLIQDATAQVQALGESLIDASKTVAAEYLNVTETTAQSVVALQRQVAEQTDVEWIASIAGAQADFTADLSKVLISSGRELLK
jgi:predicted YcjX-like family ATPase